MYEENIDDNDILLGEDDDDIEEEEEDPLKMGFYEEGAEPETDF